jgi:hypothetical protein
VSLRELGVSRISWLLSAEASSSGTETDPVSTITNDRVASTNDTSRKSVRESREPALARPAELIARQLCHADAVLVLKVYGRFMPSPQDRDKWERIADVQYKKAAVAMRSCTVLGTVPPNGMSQPQSSDWLIDSRGGTRTRDPGIMREDAEPADHESSSDDAA